MDISEMHAAILLEIDEAGSYSTDSLVPGEIDNYINSAIRDYINSQKSLLRTTGARSEESFHNLRTLVSTGSITNLSQQTYSNLYSDSLPNDYDYYIDSRAKFNDNYWIDTTFRNEQYLYGYCNLSGEGNFNTFNETSVAVSNNSLLIVPNPVDGQPTEISLSYLRDFQNVDFNSSTDSDLPEDTHRTIVELASQKILNSLVKQQKQQES